MALTNGLLLGLIYVILVTVSNLMVGKGMFLFNTLKFAGYIIYFVALGFMAAHIRKANGGYIEFRELFGAIFIILAIAWLIGYLYTFLYMYVIDPNYMDKIKESTVGFMERNKVPEEAIEKTMKDFDDSKKFNLGKSLMGYFGWLILDCLFGLVVCAIVKKKRPMFE